MKTVALIPARYDSQRFPGKLMKKLGEKTVILKTYQAAESSQLFDDVYVITDSDIIYNEISSNKGKVLKSKKKHTTGTDRIAEFANEIDADVFINIQGDEPFINKKALSQLIDVFKEDKRLKIDIASLMISIKKPSEIANPNNVKVVVDKNNFALYFSRAPIPFNRDLNFSFAYKHIGVYAFRKIALKEISKLSASKLEKIEKLENLRFLENGMKIKMIETDIINFGIDTMEDLEAAINYLKNERDEQMD